MRLKFYLILLVLASLYNKALSQNSIPVVDKISNLPASFNKVNQKIASLESRLTKQTEKSLQRLARREQKLKRKLSKLDRVCAQQLFEGSEEQYQQITNKIKGKSDKLNEAMCGEYLPGMDSLKTSLSFLQQNNQLPGNAREIQQKALLESAPPPEASVFKRYGGEHSGKNKSV